MTIRLEVNHSFSWTHWKMILLQISKLYNPSRVWIFQMSAIAIDTRILCIKPQKVHKEAISTSKAVQMPLRQFVNQPKKSDSTEKTLQQLNLILARRQSGRATITTYYLRSMMRRKDSNQMSRFRWLSNSRIVLLRLINFRRFLEQLQSRIIWTVVGAQAVLVSMRSAFQACHPKIIASLKI